MGNLRLKSAAVSDNPNLKAPKFNFSQYQVGQTYCNNPDIIDFVTDGKSLYVCRVPSVTTTKTNPAEQDGLLKLVSQGPQGPQGKKGDDGISGVTPKIDASFDDDQLRIRINGETKALSPSLTGPTGKPVLEDNILTGELTDDRYMPESIDLESLRPIQKSPLLLRTNSDNTKLSDEASGPANFIQWKYEGDPYGTNLISISELMNLALAGVSVGKATDGKWHFGHREIVRANYISDKNGRKIISNVRLGDVLFDAGELPFAEQQGINDYGADIDLIYQKLEELELAMVKSVNHIGPDPLDGNVDVETGGGASLDGYATETGVASHYQPKGNYVTSVSVNGGSPITPTNGNVNLTITSGDTVLFDVRFDNSTHKLQKTTDRQTGTDIVDLDDYSGGGLTEAQVKTLIGKILEGIEEYIPAEYVKGNDHNYFIRLNDLANYTTISQVAAMIRDAMTDQNVDYYRVFTLYQRTNSSTNIPAKPVAGVGEWNTASDVDNIALKPNASSAGSNHPENASVSTPYLGMTSATYSYLTKAEVGDGETPVCLTGENGREGEDGKGIEFIYHLGSIAPSIDYTKSKKDSSTNDRTKSGGATEASEDSCPGDGNNGYGTDDPVGIDDISEDTKIEWASIRKSHYDSVNKVTVGEDFCTPFIWAKGGEDGVDGAGVEYIFHVDASDTLANNLIPVQSLDDIYYKTNNQIDYSRPKPGYEDYDSPDWVPDGNSGRPDQNGSDNPSDVDEQQPYEWVSIRKYNGQTGHWGPFSDPKIGGLGGQKTIIQQEVVSGTTVYKPYNCYAFTRTNLDISGYRVTGGQAYDNPLNGIVTKNGNTVVQMTWSDGIPNGTEQLGSIQALIGDESQSSDAAGTSPARVGDRPGFQVEFAPSNNNTDAVYNKTKTLPSLNNYIADTPEGVDEAAGRNAASAANCGSGSDTSNENTVYMAESRIVAGSGTPGNVIKIKGEKGEPGEGLPGTPGADGTDVEFVYFRTDSELHHPGMSDTYGTYDGQTKVSEDLYEDDFFPMATGAFLSDPNVTKDTELHIGNDLFGHDHPAGVTEQLSCEWVATRHTYYQNGQKLGSAFNIALWSKYGANGRDGDGIEYVFFPLTKAQHEVVQEYTFQLNGKTYTGKLPVDNSPIMNGQSYAANGNPSAPEFLPYSTAISGVSAIRSQDDNPGGTDEKPYVYCSQRKYNGNTSSGENFGPASLGVVLEKPEVIVSRSEIRDDTIPVLVDSNGNLSMQTVRRYSSSMRYDYLYNNQEAVRINAISINGTTIATLTSSTYVPNNNVVTLSKIQNGTTVTVNVYSTEGSVDSSELGISFGLTIDFINSTKLISDFVIPITFSSGAYSGTTNLTLHPVTENDFSLSVYRPGVIKTTTRGSQDYSSNVLAGDVTYKNAGDGLYADHYLQYRYLHQYGFGYDGGTLIKFSPDGQNGFLTAQDKSDFAAQEVSLEQSPNHTAFGRVFYFDKNGTFLRKENGIVLYTSSLPSDAYYAYTIYQEDILDNKETWRKGNSYMLVNLAAFGSDSSNYPIDYVTFGGGGNDIMVDTENTMIVYNGNNGISTEIIGYVETHSDTIVTPDTLDDGDEEDAGDITTKGLLKAPTRGGGNDEDVPEVEVDENGQIHINNDDGDITISDDSGEYSTLDIANGTINKFQILKITEYDSNNIPHVRYEAQKIQTTEKIPSGYLIKDAFYYSAGEDPNTQPQRKNVYALIVDNGVIKVLTVYSEEEELEPEG